MIKFSLIQKQCLHYPLNIFMNSAKASCEISIYSVAYDIFLITYLHLDLQLSVSSSEQSISRFMMTNPISSLIITNMESWQV